MLIKFSRLVITVAAWIFVVASIATGSQYDGQWKRFAPPEGHFAVLMPGTPSGQRRSTNSPRGKIVQRSYGLRTPNSVLEVVFADYPFVPDAKTELRANRDQLVKETDTKLVSEWPINYRGNPGLEFRCERSDSIFIVRLYVIGQTVYEIVAGGYLKQIDFDEINRFVNSFQLSEAQ
jgi:hypothetical protein